MNSHSPYDDDAGLARRVVAPIRHFLDGGAHWSVYEISTEHILAARAARCLVFAKPEVIRVVWQYPPEWVSLPVQELLELSWQR
jgi:hypothetical protein